MDINSSLTPAGNTTLRDYRHAARIFTDSNFRLSPKYGFLFYVEFDFNPLITNVSNTAAQELGMIVKSVTLPKFSIDTKIHNAYNRKNIVTNKINYDPISITFHDDQSDNVRNFWYDYYSFFFRDSDYADSTYQGISKYQSRPSFDWGYSPRPTVGYNNSNLYQQYQYIQGIRIYSLYQKNFSEYHLVNPTIQSFSHGQHTNGDNNLMEHTMSIQFETVKYLTGYTTANTVGGFIDLHYDNTPSPIAPQGGTNLAPNNNGGISPVDDTVVDLAYNNPLTQASFSAAESGFGVGRVQYNGTNFNSFATAFGQSNYLGGIGGLTNGGGFSIPSFGSLSAGGITNSAILGQQLQAAGVGIAARTVSSAANGIIGGFAKGLGPNGGAIVGGLAQIIANPQAALASAENMAINYATQQVSNLVQKTTQPIIDEISGKATELAGKLSENVASAFGDLSDKVAGEARALYYEATTDTSGYSDLF